MAPTTGRSKYRKVTTSKLASSNTQKYPMLKEHSQTSKMAMRITPQVSSGMDLTKMELISKKAMVLEIQSR